MKCPNTKCKREISNNSKFCKYCGTLVVQSDRVQKVENKISDKVIAIGTMAILMVATLITIYGPKSGVYNKSEQIKDPADKITELLSENQFEEAQTVFDDNADAINGDADAQELIRKYLIEIYPIYEEKLNKGEIDTDTITRLLSLDLGKDISNNSEVYIARKKLNWLNNSKINYKSAELLYNSGKIEESIPYYASVMKNDINYEDALKKACDGIIIHFDLNAFLKDPDNYDETQLFMKSISYYSWKGSWNKEKTIPQTGNNTVLDFLESSLINYLRNTNRTEIIEFCNTYCSGL